jgi:hypothetical protein
MVKAYCETQNTNTDKAFKQNNYNDIALALTEDSFKPL